MSFAARDLVAFDLVTQAFSTFIWPVLHLVAHCRTKCFALIQVIQFNIGNVWEGDASMTYRRAAWLTKGSSSGLELRYPPLPR